MQVASVNIVDRLAGGLLFPPLWGFTPDMNTSYQLTIQQKQ